MVNSIEFQAAQSGALRYRRLVALAMLMSAVTILATIAALSVYWYAHVRTFYAVDIRKYEAGIDEPDDWHVINRTLSFWDLERTTQTIQFSQYSLTGTSVYEPLSQTSSIVKVAQGFDLIALFISAGLFIFLLANFLSVSFRTRIGVFLGPAMSRILPAGLVFAIGISLLIAALGFVGINRALDNDGSQCDCYNAFARAKTTPIGPRSFPSAETGTLETFMVVRVDDWGPQAGWFLTLLQLPFVMVLLYAVTFNRTPLPVDHQILAEAL